MWPFTKMKKFFKRVMFGYKWSFRWKPFKDTYEPPLVEMLSAMVTAMCSFMILFCSVLFYLFVPIWTAIFHPEKVDKLMEADLL